MAAEVEKLKILVAEAETRCEMKEIPVYEGIDSRFVEGQVDAMAKLPSNRMSNDSECVLLTIAELPFTFKLQEIHRKRLEDEKC